MNKAVGYIRVSTDKQDYERQRNEIKQYASRNNFVITKFFEDKHTGSDYKGRKGFQELMSYLEENPSTKIIIFDEVSRMGRDTVEQVVTYKNLSQKGVKIYTRGKGEFGKNKEDSLLFTILSAIAEYEKQTFIDRSSSGRRAVARNGGTQLSISPYGYNIILTERKDRQVIKKQFIEINEEQAPILKKMFEIIDNGGTSVDIQKYLSKNQIKTSKGKKIWGRSAILGILHNSVYYGKWQFGNPRRNILRWQKSPNKNKEIIEVDVPSIISKDLFDRVQVKLRNGKTKFNPKNQKKIYLLKGLAKCHCEKYLQCHVDTKRTYRCPQINREGVYHKTCPITPLKADFIEKILLTELKSKIEDAEFFKKLKLEKLKGYKAEFANIQKQIDNFSNKLKKEEKLLKSYYEKATRFELEGIEKKSKIYESLADEQIKNIQNDQENVKTLRQELESIQKSSMNIAMFKDIKKALAFITQKEIEEFSNQEKKLFFVRKYIKQIRLKFLEKETDEFRATIKTLRSKGIFKRENRDLKKLYMTCYNKNTHKLKIGALKILEMEVEFVNHFIIKIKFPYFGMNPDMAISYIRYSNKTPIQTQLLKIV